ncbi:uncharacterized protein LOC112687605 [Sipha flava]|uniref:Uncharacterized protein LOC112687605 n=1 Tax=Sipha flava TaxID=143950 RepID=A0A8B8FZH0_9HEMI|nr:uncharacterized protein LOC112687605 [Sipha flava]
MDNIVEGLVWYNMWSSKEVSDIMDFIDVLKETELLPSIRMCAMIAISLPATTCSVERSFSSLKRLQTWIRNSISEDRLNGLALLYIHKDIVKTEKEKVIDDVIQLFCMQPRRVQFLFNN